MQVPTYDELFNPLIKALNDLGGSGSINEITDKICENLNLPDEITNIQHADTNLSEIEYRLTWTRTYLKKYGILENSAKGIWSIKTDKSAITEVNKKDVKNFVKNLSKSNKNQAEELPLDDNDIDAPEEVQNWKDKLLSILSQMPPEAFERLIQRLLREAGFTQVEVTGKSGDGGIDGKGIFKIGGLISFNVMFQCKRWKNPVHANEIRDFRGALQGRADKGLFVTTSNFTRDALKEATRDGATPIDLMDGLQLVDKLKELELGLKVEIVENVRINDNWFKNI